MTRNWILVAAATSLVAGVGCSEEPVLKGGNIVPGTGGAGGTGGSDHDGPPDEDPGVVRPRPPPGPVVSPELPEPTDPAGPWPVVDVVHYGGGEGLPGNVTGVGVDDGQNVYVIDGNAVYALAVGKTSFVRTDSGGQFEYGYPVTTVCGGAAGKVYLGFTCPERPVVEDVTEEQKLEGDVDRMALQPDGTLALEFHHRLQNSSAKWMDHTRMIFDCARVTSGPNKGDLYVTSNHGATVIRGDDYADHRHSVWADPTTGSLAIGYVYGANTDPGGNFFFSGYWKLAVTPPAPTGDLMKWLDHHETKWIQDTYAQNLGPQEDPDELHAIAGDVSKGRLYVGSWGKGLSGMQFSPRQWWDVEGTPDSFINSLELDTDGKLWVATQSHGLWRYDEASGTWEQSPHVPAGARVNDIYLDTSVTPRALYAATNSGLYVIRAP